MRLAAVVLITLLSVAPTLAEDAGFRPLTEWRAWRGTGIPPQWTIKDGVIELQPGGGDLVSVETFHNFELSFEWRISAGGNSGVIYRSSEDFPLSYQTGAEYQILDNTGHPDGKSPLTSAASNYGLYAPSADVTKPVGEWNTARIVVSGNHVEHWLNGTEVLDYEIGSPDWKQRVAQSKFAAWPEYGTIGTGHIDLQDHGNPVAYRNLMIKVLPN
ncbi:MAG TPA: DUF1080 domain-containing protein [Devosia sp.]|nr:DUF1080 domain-containing protein [Devosia sp.]